MYKRNTLHLLWLGLALVISACGFHLKGTQRAQSSIEPLYLVIDGQNEQTTTAILELMAQNNINLVEIEDSRYVVRISNSIRERDVTAVGGKVGDVEELDIVDGFMVSIRESGEEIGQTTIVSRTSISYASSQYLGSREEEARAHRQLARDNADKLLRFINARLGQ